MKLRLKTSFLALFLFCLTASMADAYYFYDNFDSYSSLSNTQWDYVPPQAILDETGGYGGSKAIKFIYSGEQYFPLEEYPGAGTDHMYFRFKFKVNANPVGGIKFLKIMGAVGPGPSYANWTWNFGPTTATPSFLTALCYGEGSILQNDTNVCIYPDGTVNGPAGNVALEYGGKLFVPNPGQWYEVTTYNRYSTNGNADGEMWMEIDGKRILHVANVKNRNDANPRKIERIQFAAYSNRNANMTIWYDDIEISDSPFPGTSITHLNPPTGLKIIP